MKIYNLTDQEIQNIADIAAKRAVSSMAPETKTKETTCASLQDLCKRYHRSVPTLRKLFKEGKLPGSKIGRKYSFDIVECDAALRGRLHK